MMGPRQQAQPALFYEFSLEDHVPQDHLLRSIDRFVDLSGIRTFLADFYSHTGRPSVDPELLIRMLLVGYCFGIRSERRLCEEVHLNLAYRWFCRLDLSDRVPDHSTFSKNRHGRFRDSELLRHLFETTVARCIEEGLVSGQRMAIDASLIEADANKQNSTPKEDWDAGKIDPTDAPWAVREYLDTLDEAAFGAASEVQPKFTSHSDPASQWTAARKGPAFFSYSDNYLIDTDHGVIVDVEATRSIRQAEVGSTKTMLERVKARFDLHPERLIADTAYGTAPMLGWLVDRKIAPHIPVFDKSGVRQVGAQRRNLDPRRLRVGRRERPIYLPRGARVETVPPELLRPQPRAHRQGHSPLSRPQGDLSGMSIQGRCCRTLTVEDSHCESMRLDGPHEQAITRSLSHDELVQLHGLASQARVAADLAGQGHVLACAA